MTQLSGNALEKINFLLSLLNYEISCESWKVEIVDFLQSLRNGIAEAFETAQDAK